MSVSRREFLKVAGALGLIAAAGGTLPLSTACKSNAVKSGKTLKVGVMTPSTGPAAEKGKPGQDGLLACFNYINTERNGVNGYLIEPIWRDSKYDMAVVPTIVTEFMDKGCLMFTTHASAEMTAAMSIANPAEFPGMSTFTSQTLYHPPKHIYGQMPDYGDDWIGFAKYYLANIWKGSGKPKMALHLLSNSTGKGAEYGATAMADSLGIQIVANEQHTATITSAIDSLTRIKALKPDVMFISSTPQPTSIILKDAHSLGMYPGITIGCAHASFTSALVQLAGADVAEGVYGVYSTVTWADSASGIAKATEYCKKYNNQDFGNMDYLSTWSSALVVAEILKLALNNVGYDALSKGDVTAWRAVEKSGIQKLNGYKVEGLTAPVNYTLGDQRLSKALKIFNIKSGTITAIGDWVDAPYIKYEDYSWFPKA